MTHVTCRLTAKNRAQLRNPAHGDRVWTTFRFFTTLTLTGHKGQFDAIATGHRLWLRDGRGTQIVSTSREQQTYTQYVPLPSCRTVSVFRFFAAIVSNPVRVFVEDARSRREGGDTKRTKEELLTDSSCETKHVNFLQWSQRYIGCIMKLQ